MKTPRIAIIGGGPAGCMAAYYLQKRGYEVDLFEKERAVGGRTRTDRSEGLLIDSGAGFFTNFYSLYLRIMKELGVENEMISMDRSISLAHKGKVASLKLGSLTSFISFPFLSMGEKVKFLTYALKLRLMRNSLDLTDLEKLENYDDKSFSDEVRDRLGENTYHYLSRALIEPFWYFSCEDISRALGLAVKSHLADARVFTMKSGMDRLCIAMTNAMNLYLENEVTQLKIQNDNTVEVSFSQGAINPTLKRESYHAVILATPASAAYALTRDLPNTIVSNQQKEFLRSQTYVANVHAVYRMRRSQNLLNRGSVFPCGPGNHKLAALSFDSLKYKDDKIVRVDQEIVHVFISGSESPNFLKHDRKTRSQLAWQYAKELCPELPFEAECIAVYERAEAIPVHEVGRYKLANYFISSQNAPVFFAGDYLNTATIEGAFQSGLASASLLEKALAI